MSYLKKIIFILLSFSASLSCAADFPIGSFKGVGFIVEKGSKKMTQENLSKFESNLTITKLDNSKVAFKVSVKMQRHPSTPIKTDNRYDVYTVKWDNENTGSLLNSNKQYSDDTSSFKINGNKLTIKSWISRHQLFETHVYEKQ